ncbi:hypothetical protein HOP54_20710 [Halomonas daqingensis]|nr:hypothetical protein [Halomonas desiderata]
MVARFDGGNVTSDGGILLPRQLDTRSVARRLSDARDPQRCQHRTETLVRQRVFGLALGCAASPTSPNLRFIAFCRETRHGSSGRSTPCRGTRKPFV